MRALGGDVLFANREGGGLRATICPAATAHQGYRDSTVQANRDAVPSALKPQTCRRTVESVIENKSLRMQLDPMRTWLKALVMLVALAAGFPCAAWAHPGHEHGTQPPVGAVLVLDRVTLATDVGQPLRLDHLTLHGFDASAISASPERRIAHPDKSGEDSHFADLRRNLDAAPAHKPVQPVHESTCCCASVACHAGVDVPTLTVTDPWGSADKVELPPVLALAATIPGGIERPPRSAIAL